jgi:hypothetical protein
VTQCRGQSQCIGTPNDKLLQLLFQCTILLCSVGEKLRALFMN